MDFPVDAVLPEVRRHEPRRIVRVGVRDLALPARRRAVLLAVAERVERPPKHGIRAAAVGVVDQQHAGEAGAAVARRLPHVGEHVEARPALEVEVLVPRAALERDTAKPGWRGAAELDAAASALQAELSAAARKLKDQFAPGSAFNRSMQELDDRVSDMIRRTADGVSAAVSRRREGAGASTTEPPVS